MSVLRNIIAQYADALSESLRDLGLTANQFHVITALDAAGQLSASRAAIASVVPQQTTSAILNRFTLESVVRRSPMPTHATAMSYTLTQAGEIMLSSARARADEVNEAFRSWFSPADRIILCEAARALTSTTR